MQVECFMGLWEKNEKDEVACILCVWLCIHKYKPIPNVPVFLSNRGARCLCAHSVHALVYILYNMSFCAQNKIFKVETDNLSTSSPAFSSGIIVVDTVAETTNHFQFSSEPSNYQSFHS